MKSLDEEFERLAVNHHYTYDSMAEAATFIEKNCKKLKDDPILAVVMLVKTKIEEDISDQPEQIQAILKEAAAMLIDRPDPKKEKSLPDAEIGENGVQQVLCIDPPCDTCDGLHCQP